MKLNMKAVGILTSDLQQDLIEFTQSLVQIRSISGQEEEIIRFAAQRMSDLGYDEVTIDAMGNLLGRIGSGDKAILFDSHVDTVAVTDEAQWEVPPFSGTIVDGYLYGRGSVDMKSSVAASIVAGALAKRSGWLSGKTVYVSCSVLEEDCDGENLKHLFHELQLKPDYVVICEPSDNLIALGHKGKAQVRIKTHGVSAHGAAPEKGVNPIYAMAEIIQRVERLNSALMQNDAPRGSLAMTSISSRAASLNAVPSECEAYLDRRIAPGEMEAEIKQEFDQLIQGQDASWEVDEVTRRSWTGLELRYRPFHPAWIIDRGHPLIGACAAAYQDIFDHAPKEYVFWDFSTNAVTPVSLGIPTIGFGPGDYKLAHMRNERCKVDQLVDACGFYAYLIHRI
jgi:putative selenium metabolism hydrolase